MEPDQVCNIICLGVVKTDPVSFLKSLDINSDTKQLEWNFISAKSINITNSLTISKFEPYKVADYDIINEMLNELKDGGDTVKKNLVKGLNLNFTGILKPIVHENNDVWILSYIDLERTAIC